MSEEIENIFDAKNNHHIMSAHSGTDDSIYNMIVRKKQMFPTMYHFF